MRDLKIAPNRIIPFMYKRELERAFGKLRPQVVEERVILDNWHDKTFSEIKDLVFLVLSHHLVDPLETEHLHDLIYLHKFSFPMKKED